jgi:hypothetical protein
MRWQVYSVRAGARSANGRTAHSATPPIVSLLASPAVAQDRNRGRGQGVPPGHLPSPGECRVWYDGRPPGQQPPPTNCREAERVASRERSARVIYGGYHDEGQWGNRYPYPDPDRYPGRSRYPDRYPNERGRYGIAGSVPFDNGHRDGYEKGIEDARDNNAYDPVRHSRYRSADREYDRRYRPREEYRDIYREGFRAGYDEGHGDVSGRDRRDSRDRRVW